METTLDRFIKKEETGKPKDIRYVDKKYKVEFLERITQKSCVIKAIDFVQPFQLAAKQTGEIPYNRVYKEKTR